MLYALAQMTLPIFNKLKIHFKRA